MKKMLLAPLGLLLASAACLADQPAKSDKDGRTELCRDRLFFAAHLLADTEAATVSSPDRAPSNTAVAAAATMAEAEMTFFDHLQCRDLVSSTEIGDTLTKAKEFSAAQKKTAK